MAGKHFVYFIDFSKSRKLKKLFLNKQVNHPLRICFFFSTYHIKRLKALETHFNVTFINWTHFLFNIFLYPFGTCIQNVLQKLCELIGLKIREIRNVRRL